MGYVRQVPVAGECTTGIRQSLRERKPGARRGQCGEPEMLQVSRGADVPRVRNHETARLVERAESLAAGPDVRGRSRAFGPISIRGHRLFEHFHRMLQ